MSNPNFRRYVAFTADLRGKHIAEHDSLPHLLQQVASSRRCRWTVADFHNNGQTVARGTGAAIFQQEVQP